MVIVWPHGTEVVGDNPPTVDIPDYGTFTVGDRVLVGGGFVIEHSSDDIEPGPYEVAGVTFPAACAKHDIFLAN